MERGGSHSMHTLSNSGPAWKHSFWHWFRSHHNLWSRGNLDAAFAQFFNTIISLMLIVTVCHVRPWVSMLPPFRLCLALYLLYVRACPFRPSCRPGPKWGLSCFMSTSSLAPPVCLLFGE
jgi:hypothetical protein